MPYVYSVYYVYNNDYGKLDFCERIKIKKKEEKDDDDEENIRSLKSKISNNHHLNYLWSVK